MTGEIVFCLAVAAFGLGTLLASLFGRGESSLEETMVVHSAETYETPLEQLLRERRHLASRLSTLTALAGLAGDPHGEIGWKRKQLKDLENGPLLAAARDREPLEQELARLRTGDARLRARVGELEDRVRQQALAIAEYRKLFPPEQVAAARELLELENKA